MILHLVQNHRERTALGRPCCGRTWENITVTHSISCLECSNVYVCLCVGDLFFSETPFGKDSASQPIVGRGMQMQLTQKTKDKKNYLNIKHEMAHQCELVSGGPKRPMSRIRYFLHFLPRSRCVWLGDVNVCVNHMNKCCTDRAQGVRENVVHSRQIYASRINMTKISPDTARTHSSRRANICLV